MWKRVRNNFITGLIVVAPVAITAYILVALFNFFDGLLGDQLSWLIWTGLGLDHRAIAGDRIPGVGAIVTIVLLIFTGWLAAKVIGQRLLHYGEGLMRRVPVVRNVYSTTKQIIDSLTNANKGAFKQVVAIEYPRLGIWTVGFLTNELPSSIDGAGPSCCVFVATVPNPTSGFVVMVPRDEVIFLDMSVEDGLKLVISGGVIAPSGLPWLGGDSGDRADKKGQSGRK